MPDLRPAIAAKTFRVDFDRPSSGNGINAPWNTPEAIDWSLITPGATLVCSGTFTSTGNRLQVGSSGFPGLPIVIDCKDAVFDGAQSVDEPFRIQSQHDIIVSGGRFTGGDDLSGDGTGLACNFTENISIVGGEFDNNYFQGIRIRSSRGVCVAYCDVHNNGVKGVVIANELTQPLPYRFDARNEGNVVEYCTIYDNGRHGIQFGSANGGSSPSDDPIVIRFNEVYGNGNGLYAEDACGARVYGNTVYDNDNPTDGVGASPEQMQLLINGGIDSHFYGNLIYSTKTLSLPLLDFQASNYMPQGHHIYANRMRHQGNHDQLIRFNLGTPLGAGFVSRGLKIYSNVLSIDVDGSYQTNDRSMTLANAEDSVVANNTFIGGNEHCKLIRANSIPVLGWSFYNNLHVAPGLRAYGAATTSDKPLDISNEAFWTMPLTYAFWDDQGNMDASEFAAAYTGTQVEVDPEFLDDTNADKTLRDYQHKNEALDGVGIDWWTPLGFTALDFNRQPMRSEYPSIGAFARARQE